MQQSDCIRTLESKKISFRKESDDFVLTLKERVHLYFQEHKISHKATVTMYLKVCSYFVFVLGIYTLLLTGIGGSFALLSLYLLLGFSLSIGMMNVSHDALHGALVSNPKINRAFGYFMDLFGTSSYYWKKEHVVDHHTFTNIADHDADLDVPFLLRLSQTAPLRRFHRFQQWYAPFLYSLNLIHWIYVSDFKRFYALFFSKKQTSAKPTKLEIFLMLFFKCVHIALFVGVPLIVLEAPFWLIIIGYIGFLSVSGITLTTIFQLAHIVENVAFPLPNEEGKMETNFIKHQMHTTSNFAMNSRLVGFLFGGLNFQIEHHLFPHVCHMHLSAIAPIVRATAQEYSIPYHHNPSFFKGLRSHFRTLKKLGSCP